MDVSDNEAGDGSGQTTPRRFPGPQSAASAAGAATIPEAEHRAHGPSTRPTGRSNARQELAAEIAGAKPLITGRPVVYFDTVDVLLRADLSPRASAELGKFCGSLRCGTSKACGSGYPNRLTLNQPTNEAVELVETNLDHIVSRFDVAIDLRTLAAADATALASVVRRLAIQPRHGKRQSRDVMATTAYAAPRGARRNFTVYGDKVSKATSEPCCHIEFRFKGTRACQARGVRTCGNLVTYDPAPFINRDLKLALIDWQRAFQILRRLHPTKRPVLRQALIEKTFEALASPGHTPSFTDPPRFTQAALDVMPEWRCALVSTSLNDLFCVSN